MEDNINDIVKLSLELIICSIVVLIIAMFSTLAYRAYGVREVSKKATANVEVNASLYHYNNRQVGLQDIIELIETETDNFEYKFYTSMSDYNSNRAPLFEISNTVRMENYNRDRNDELLTNYWSDTSIENALLRTGDSTYSDGLYAMTTRFSAFPILSDDGITYSGIAFVES